MIDVFEAVIFDLDGVLAFTEPAIFRILTQLAATYGVELNKADNQALFGLDYPDTVRYLQTKYGIPETEERLVELLLHAVLDQIEDEMEPAPGGFALVTDLAKRGVRVGLASNSPSEYVRRIVRGLGLAPYLPVPVGRDDVSNGKPFPDPYLEACRRAGANPARSLAIEDSPVGAQAALSAGMSCVMIADGIPFGFEQRVSLMPNLPALHKAFLPD
jgi:HAD superfamily hydrolase (TIGR01509 family)